jgi:hypothetical protein
MNIRALAARKAAGLGRSPPGMTRRRFVGTAAGTALLGGALGAGLLKPSLAAPKTSFGPVPIPAGGGMFHVFPPGLNGVPEDAEPSTITNLNGFVGLAYLDGMVTQTNTETGEVLRLPFLTSDMRFMQGDFRGTDGRVHQGTFALVWVDVYQSSVGGDQLHDLNPSTFPPVGLFWTIPLPDDSVEVQLGKGSASLQAFDVPVFDYGNLNNALMGPPPSPLPTGSVSATVVWSGVQQRVNIRNTDPVFGGFAGEFIRNKAQMEWTATVGDYTFVSDPLATSSSEFAEIGHERNGSFFPRG